jgi:hypothetical protein
MIYGFGGCEPLLLRGFGLSPGDTFGVILVSSTFGGGIGLATCSLLGESAERRLIILLAAIVTAVMLGVCCMTGVP